MPTLPPEHVPQESSVRVSETGVECLQLVGRAQRATFLAGGRRAGEDYFSDPSPYDLLAAALASCTGFLAIRAIRHISRSTPIVVLATFADEAVRPRGLSLDHTICLSKTATPVEVLEALRTFATRSAPGEHR